MTHKLLVVWCNQLLWRSLVQITELAKLLETKPLTTFEITFIFIIKHKNSSGDEIANRT